MVSLDPIVDRLFDEALKLGASDIHLEPEEQSLGVRYRVGGLMRDGFALDGALREGVTAKLKLMARLDSTQTLIPQDGAFVLKGVQVRLSVIPALGGQSVVMRLFKKVKELENLEGLGLDKKQVAEIKKIVGQTHGLFIIAGPTGSGKTTTFYAALRAIDPAAQKIITVEDPVEQRLEGVCQTPVGSVGSNPRHAGRENAPVETLTFATALRSILRQAPNVIGVGELRDTESAKMALQAALTGHLVIATLHADSAARVPARLIDMGLEAGVLAEVLGGVLAQRLLMTRTEAGGSVCTGVFEVMTPDEKICAAIKKCAGALEFQSILEEQKFVTLKQRAEGLVKTGRLSREAMLAEFVE
jgi:type II secretory ATPase GspE/PulE/Tfp pilus assembly ATPase PilB-like protein